MDVRALVAHRLDGLDGLEFGELARPTAGPGEILVRMHFAGINPADWKTAEGYLYQLPSFDPELPFVIGLEGSGTVAELGEGATGFATGDRVVLKSDISQGRWGTYCEFIAIEPNLAAKLPDDMALDHAAALPIAGLTSWHSLLVHGALKPGETVFVHAGAGGVGSFAVQIAAMAGARVFASCSPANSEYLKARGAQETFDYRDEDMAAKVRAAGACDVILDAICDGRHDLSACLTRRGRYVTIPTLDPKSVRPDGDKLSDAGAVHIAGGLIRDRTREGLEALVELYRQGLVLPELHVLPVEQFIQALDDCKSGKRRGKAVIRLWEARDEAPSPASNGERARQ